MIEPRGCLAGFLDTEYALESLHASTGLHRSHALREHARYAALQISGASVLETTALSIISTINSGSWISFGSGIGAKPTDCAGSNEGASWGNISNYRDKAV